MIPDELHVVDARIDGGREVLLVARGFVERRLNPRAQLGSETLAASTPASRKQPLPVQAKVRI
jgi:hypothetical protein